MSILRKVEKYLVHLVCMWTEKSQIPSPWHAEVLKVRISVLKFLYVYQGLVDICLFVCLTLDCTTLARVRHPWSPLYAWCFLSDHIIICKIFQSCGVACYLKEVCHEASCKSGAFLYFRFRVNILWFFCVLSKVCSFLSQNIPDISWIEWVPHWEKEIFSFLSFGFIE